MELDKKVQQKLQELLTEECYRGHALQLEVLAGKLELEVFDADFDDPKISGAIYREEEKFCIYVNKKHAVTRKRFTVAHEIGHYISAICESYSKEELSKNDGGLEDYAYRKVGHTSPAETEANEIAAHMLMPEQFVMLFVNQGMSIEDMAEMFFVSQQAMAIRVNNLGFDIL